MNDFGTVFLRTPRKNNEQIQKLGVPPSYGTSGADISPETSRVWGVDKKIAHKSFSSQRYIYVCLVSYIYIFIKSTSVWVFLVFLWFWASLLRFGGFPCVWDFGLGGGRIIPAMWSNLFKYHSNIVRYEKIIFGPRQKNFTMKPCYESRLTDSCTAEEIATVKNLSIFGGKQNLW